jgi:hypothetical protein
VKQKSQSSADFLGVMTVSENVLDGCCIPTTILAISVSPGRHPEPEKLRVERRHWGSATESTIILTSGGPATKEAAAMVAAAS